MDARRHTELLARVSWARGLGWEQVEALATHMTVDYARSGATVLAEGQRRRAVSVIVDGLVAVSRRGPEGIERRIATLGPGRYFGEVSILDGEPSFASIRAVTSLELLTLTSDALDVLVDEDPRLALEIFRRLGRMDRYRRRIGARSNADPFGGVAA